MTQPVTPPVPPPVPPAPPAQDPPKPPTWDDLFKDEDPAKVKEALENSRRWEQRAKDNKTAAEKLALIEEAQKTEAQKLADRAAAAEKERDDARLDVLRVRVGAAKNLPADVVELLRGDTEQELAAHADRLATHLKTGVRTDPDMGPRGAAPTQGPAQEFASFLQGQLRQT